jgi:hypothetical protein
MHRVLDNTLEASLKSIKMDIEGVNLRIVHPLIGNVSC